MIYFDFQPDGGITQLSIDLLYRFVENPIPIWRVRNQHYWTWDYAQVKISNVDKFRLLITAERGDNKGNMLIFFYKIGI